MRVLAVDPGMETGLVYAELGDDSLTILDRLQVTGGLEGFVEHMERVGYQSPVVCEKFRVTPRVFRAAEVEALRIEGAVLALWTDVVFQYNDAMLIGGRQGTRAGNKRAADDVLRKMGLWTTGSQIGRPDANDVNAAMKHLVHYLNGIDNPYVVSELERINGL